MSEKTAGVWNIIKILIALTSGWRFLPPFLGRVLGTYGALLAAFFYFQRGSTRFSSMCSGTCNCHLPEVCPVSTEGQPYRFRKIVALRGSGHWNMSGVGVTGTCMSKSGNCRKHEI